MTIPKRTLDLLQNNTPPQYAYASISFDHVNDSDLDTLLPLLVEFRHDSHLAISSTDLSSEGMTKLIQALESMPRVKGISFSPPKADGKIFEALAKLIQHSKTLRSLRVSSVEGAININGIADALKENDSLVELDLSRIKIGASGWKELADSLREHPSLKRLRLDEANVGDVGAIAIAELLKQNSTIRDLNLGGNNIGDSGSIALADALKHNTALHDLSLHNNKIGNVGAIAFADVLKENHTLKDLIFYQNQVSAEGAEALAQALEINTTLLKLSLGDQALGDRAARAFSDALKCNNTLTSLYLDNTSIGDDGAMVLAEALQHNDALAKLWLNENKLTNRTAKAFSDVLKVNHSLMEFQAKKTRIDADGLGLVLDVLAVNRGLSTLCMHEPSEEKNDTPNDRCEDALIQSGNPNVRYIGGVSTRLQNYCSTNQETANALLEKIQSPDYRLTQEDMEAIRSRMPILLDTCSALVTEGGYQEAARIMSTIKQGAKDQGVAVAIPPYWKNFSNQVFLEEPALAHSYKEGLAYEQKQENGMDQNSEENLLGRPESDGLGDSSLQSGSKFIQGLLSQYAGRKAELARRDKALIPMIKAIEQIGREITEKEKEKSSKQTHLNEVTRKAEINNPPIEGEIRSQHDDLARLRNGDWQALYEFQDWWGGHYTGYYRDKYTKQHEQRIAELKKDLVDVSPAKSALENVRKTIEQYKENHKNQVDAKIEAEQSKTYEVFTQFLLDEQAIRTSTMIASCAQNAGTSLEEMLEHPLIQKLVQEFASGRLTRETLDTALEWTSIYKNTQDMAPEELAFKQFVNRRVIPNIGSFEALASMVDDFQRTGIEGYPRLELLKQKEVTFSGKKEIGNKEESEREAEKLAKTLSAAAAKINGALTTSEPILARLDNAIAANEEHLDEFEKLFSSIEDKIEALVKEADDKLKEKTERMQKMDRAVIRNERLQDQIDQSKFDITTRKKYLTKEKPRAVRMLNEGLNGAGDGAIRGLAWGDPHSTGAGAGLGFLRGLTKGFRKKIDPQKIEVDIRNELVEYLNAQQVDTNAHAADIKDISDKITGLLNDKAFQEKVSDDLKIQRIQNAYVTRMLLYSGRHNAYLLNEACEMNGDASLDTFLNAFKGELGMSLKRFCYGIANSNDMALILHEANALSGALSSHNQTLKDFVEQVVKPDINSFLAAASKVDAIGQSNLLPYGAPFQLTQGIVRDETDPKYKALMANEFGVSTVGLQDVRRAFDFYLHRHGNKVFYDSHLKDGQGTDLEYPKRIHVEPRESIISFVNKTKQAMSRGAQEQPQVSDIFLRICGYEYFLPQAIHTAGINNIFSENPEAPAAYPMVNDTVNHFIEKMSLGPIQKYRELVGEPLDNIIAQTFVDYFAHLGLRHDEDHKIKEARTQLRNSANSDKYGPIFSAYVRRITQDSTGNFELFMDIYKNNLQHELPTMPAEERALLQEYLATLPDPAKTILTPEIIKPGSPQAGFIAKYEDHTFKNTLSGQLGRR